MAAAVECGRRAQAALLVLVVEDVWVLDDQRRRSQSVFLEARRTLPFQLPRWSVCAVRPGIIQKVSDSDGRQVTPEVNKRLKSKRAWKASITIPEGPITAKCTRITNV